MHAVPIEGLLDQPTEKYASGLEALKQDQFDVAESLGTNYVLNNPRDGRAHLILLLSWYGQERHGKIENHLRELDARLPDVSPSIRTSLGTLYLRNRDLTRAIDCLIDIPEQSRSSVAWSTIGETYLQLGEINNAEAAYRQALKKDEGVGETPALGLARVLMMKGEFKQALVPLRRVLMSAPRHDPTLIMAATLHLRLNQPVQAADIVKTLKQQRPHVAAVISLIALTDFANENYSQARSWFQELDARPAWKDLSVAGRALTHIQEGKTSAARTILDGESFDSQVLTAMLKAAFSQRGNANAISGHLRQMAPIWVDAKREEFDLSTALGDSTATMGAVNQSLVTAAIRHLYLSQGFPELATILPHDAAQPHDSLIEGLIASRALAKEGRLKQTIALLKQLIDEYPDFVAPRLEMADIHFQTGSANLAIKGYRESIKQAPELDELVLRLGDLYNATDHPELALEQYRLFLNRQPDSSYALNQAAATLSSLLDQPSKALPLAQKAFELTPDNYNVADTLISIYLKLGREQEAEQVARSFNTTL
ncbi:tetratricopeptide repeat protein [Marinobacter sediminum]|uniref:tetratricopeptide repeat protein n=1 Tax=Marinobacter sediminum TaxID=256323 RepID=UPI002030F4A1|nr:tetratricopeptide repeat protein [Marinobacter sediminum]